MTNIAQCFALENILFLQTTVVFRHVVIECCRRNKIAMTNDSNSNENENTNEKNDKSTETKESDASEETNPSNSIEINDGDDLLEEKVWNMPDTNRITRMLTRLRTMEQSPILRTVLQLKFAYLTDLYQTYEALLFEDKNNDIKSIESAMFNIAQTIYYQYLAKDSFEQINLPHVLFQRYWNLFENEKFINKETNSNDFINIVDYLYIFNDAIIETWYLMISIYNFQFERFIKRLIDVET